MTARFVVNPWENRGQALSKLRSRFGYAWVSLTYTVAINPETKAYEAFISDLKGSLIPSHYIYWDGQLVYKYNMDNSNAKANLEAFVKAGDSKTGTDWDVPGEAFTKDVAGFTVAPAGKNLPWKP